MFSDTSWALNKCREELGAELALPPALAARSLTVQGGGVVKQRHLLPLPPHLSHLYISTLTFCSVEASARWLGFFF